VNARGRTAIATSFDICSVGFVAELQDLVEALAERLGRPVSIEDRRYRVLAYSAHAEPLDRVRLASILTREAPADVARWLDARGLQRAAAPVRLPDAPHVGMGPRVAVPVRGDGVLGFVWLVDDGVGAEELAAAEATAAAAAPLLARMRAAERSENALVAGLLDTDTAARGRAAAALRERGLRGPVRVLAGDGVPRGSRIVRGAAAALLFGGDAALAAEPGGVIGMSAPRDRLEDAHEALAEAQAAAALARPDGRTARPGGGAGRAARTGPDSDSSAIGAAVVRWDALGSYRLLVPLVDAALPAALQRLLDHADADTLTPTLEAYLDRAGDARAAAQALFIHRTSLYHRLRRIEAITGANLRDGDDRLALHIGLRGLR
jgi:PucR C-terminal helix-turn-helix domain